MHLRVVNVKVAHRHNVFVCKTITVQATLFKCIKKIHMLGWRVPDTNYNRFGLR